MHSLWVRFVQVKIQCELQTNDMRAVHLTLHQLLARCLEMLWGQQGTSRTGIAGLSMDRRPYNGSSKHTCMNFHMHLHSLWRRLVGQDDIAQPIVQMPYGQVRMRGQLCVQQCLDVWMMPLSLCDLCKPLVWIGKLSIQCIGSHSWRPEHSNYHVEELYPLLPMHSSVLIEDETPQPQSQHPTLGVHQLWPLLHPLTSATP